MNNLKAIISKAWDERDVLNTRTNGEVREAVILALEKLDKGQVRVAENKNGDWVVNEWLKKAVLMSFVMNEMELIVGGADAGSWYDKVPSKFKNWTEEEFQASGFRAVPGSIVRKSAYISKGVVLMPSFINVGAFVGECTMVDAWTTVGSCAQIGRNVHLSGGVGIGGVLEPIQASPVIIEDDCFIGARSEVAEGVIVEKGAVLSMGVYLGASTKIIDRETGETYKGRVPAYSVVVPGAIPGAKLPNGCEGPSIYAAVIVKKVDAQTRSKTSINELLRD